MHFSRLSKRPRWPLSKILLGLLTAVIGSTPTAYYYIRVKYGFRQANFDVREAWLPVATHILNGVPLYVRPAVDNKPPGWELLNVAVAATGQYLILWSSIIILANLLTAYLLYRLVAREYPNIVGWVAAIIYLSTIFFTNAAEINVRSVAAPLLLLSLYSDRTLVKGGSVALAAHSSQYAVLGFVLIAIQEFSNGLKTDRLTRIVAIGGVVAFIPYLLVGAIWGVDSAINGVYWTLGQGGEYITTTGGRSIIAKPTAWIISILHMSLQLSLALGLGLIGLFKTFQRGAPSDLERILIAGVAVFSIPLLIRSYGVYWIFPLIFLSAVASVGIANLLLEQKSTMG